jgi:5-methylcytosine-specific restriction enzyme subunit McrC
VTSELAFKEWGRSRTLILTPGEARILARHSYAVRSEDRGGGRYRVGPAPGYVGSLRLSASKTLTITPKLPLDSFAALLSLAYDEEAIPIRSDHVGVGVGDLSAWCIAQTVAEAQRLIASGVRRDYVPVEEHRSYPRGRLQFSGTSPRFDGALSCVTDEFVLDTEINRYVKAGLKYLSTLELARPWNVAIRSLSSDLSGITNVPWRPADCDFLKRPIFREYRPLISLLRLIATSQGSEFDQGNLDVSAFFFRLHDLFELAVYRVMRRVGQAASVIYQPPLRNVAIRLSGSPDLGITFKPDVAIKAPTAAIQSASGKWRLVIDAKYRNPIKMAQYRRAFRNDNIYQIMSYSRVFHCPGLLVYPRVDQDVDITYRVGGTLIGIRTVNLLAPNLVDEMTAFATAAVSDFATQV